MNKFLITFILFFLLAGCDTNQYVITQGNQQNSSKVDLIWYKIQGAWKGKQLTSDGQVRITNYTYYPNGKSEVRFQYYDKNNNLVKEHTQIEQWGAVDDILFAIIEGWNVDGEFIPSPVDPLKYSVYKIIKVTPETLEYRSLRTKDTFVLKRVANNSDLSI